MGLNVSFSLLVAFMCGRTACTLARDDIMRACSYKDRKGKRRRPMWKDAPGGHQYKTSYNMTPGSFTPVLVSSKHFPDVSMTSEPETEHADNVLMPMKWGLVPHWHKDSPSKVAFKTSNCRGESMLEKSTFKVPLQQGRRCVVLMDGFYEWKTTPSGKQPHYFRVSPTTLQEENKNVVKVENKSDIKVESTTSDRDSLQPHKSDVKVESTTSDRDSLQPHKSDVKVESTTSDRDSLQPLSFKDVNEMKVEDFKEITHVKKELKLEDLSDTEKIKLESISTSGDTFKDNEAKLMPGNVIKQEYSCEGKAGCSKTDLELEQEEEEEEEEEEAKEWTGHRLLTCAAVYDVWQPSKSSHPLFSYSIITVAASSDMDWCHHRMPAVLSTDQEVCDWLDFSTVPLNKANALIYPKSDCLTSHPVSKSVNNSHYQSPDCVQPIDINNPSSESKKKLSGSGQMMMNWLKRGPSSTSVTDSLSTKAAKM